MVINRNISALNANYRLKVNNNRLSNITEKLSSGYRINRAADDAAGLTISEKMRNQIRGLSQASRNCQDGVSVIQVADGALEEVHAMLQRMNELSVQSANGTNTESDREALQKEFEQIQTEIDRVSDTTTFNTMKLFAEAENTDTEDGVTSLVEGAKASVGGPVGTENIVRAVATPGTTIDLGTLSGDLEIKSAGNYILTGTLAKGNKITVSADANITLKNVYTTYTAFTINGSSTVNMNLEGSNNIFAYNQESSSLKKYGNDGILINSGSTLNISGVGTLNCKTMKNSGIRVAAGGTLNINGGTVVTSSTYREGSGIRVEEGAKLNINDGNVTANGGDYSAGIGGGQGESTGTNNIKGGTVTATGGSSGAGIGSGEQGKNATITITGGTVTAKGGYNGAGIGSGYKGQDATIKITGGTVNTTGGEHSSGIGSGDEGQDVTISISGGNVTAKSGADGPGIGVGAGGKNGTIIISGGTVTAEAVNDFGYAIGKGGFITSGTVSFSTGAKGNATITTIGDNAISDESDKDNWSGTINGVVYGKPDDGGDDDDDGDDKGSGGSKEQWSIQAGALDGQGIEIKIGTMNTKVLGIDKDSVNIQTEDSASSAITSVGTVIDKVSEQRSRLGAYQNRLEHTIANLDSTAENTSSAESRIRDLDMAEAMVEYSKENILMQVAQSMLSQANQQPQGVLSLWQG